MSQSSPETVTAAEKRNGRRKILLILLGAAVVLALIWGVGAAVHSWRYVETDDAFIEGHITAVAAKVAGHVVKLHVVDNQMVRESDLLLEIDPRDFESRLNEAEAAAASAEAKLKSAAANLDWTRATTEAAITQAQAGVELAAAQIEAARQAVAAARAAEAQVKAEAGVSEAEMVRSREDLERLEPLRQSGTASPQEITNARAAQRTAEARVTAAAKRSVASEEAARQAEAELKAAEARKAEAEARLTAARAGASQISIAQAALVTAEADLRQKQAAAEQARLNRSYTKLFAPREGRVTRRTVEVGAYVQPGQALLALVSPQVWVIANFKETQITHMKPGQAVRVHVDAYPDHVFAAKVDSIQSGSGARFSLLPPENATGNYVKVVQRVPVKIVFNEPPDNRWLLGPGMSVVPEVDTAD